MRPTLGTRLAHKLDMDMSNMALHVAKLLEPHWEKLKAAREAGAYGEGEGKVPLLLTNSVGFFLGDKEVLDLADIPDDLMGEPNEPNPDRNPYHNPHHNPY